MASLEYNCEEFIIQMLKQAEGDPFAAYPIRHFDLRTPAVREAFVVRAVRGVRNFDGCQPYEVNTSVSFSTSNLTPDEADELMKKAAVALENRTPVLVGIELKFLTMEQGGAIDRRNTSKLRVRTVTIPMLAKV